MAINSFEIEGLNELIKALEGFTDQAMPYVKDASNEGGAVVLEKAKELVPTDTKNLKEHLVLRKVSTINPNKPIAFSRVTAKKGAAYYIPLELGHNLVSRTRKILGQGATIGFVKARPFLRPAADISKNKVVDITVNALNKALDNIGGLKK
jgi:HK97 gp10 family phage protein